MGAERESTETQTGNMAEAVSMEAKFAKLQKSSVDHLTCFWCQTYIRSGPIYKSWLAWHREQFAQPANQNSKNEKKSVS